MEFQLLNFGFSMFGVVGIAGVLGLLVFFGLRYLKTVAPVELYPKARAAIFVLWILIVAIMTMSTFANNSPKLTLEDHGKQRPVYSTDAEIQNLNPNTLTDQERIEYNRELIEQNSLGY